MKRLFAAVLCLFVVTSCSTKKGIVTSSEKKDSTQIGYGVNGSDAGQAGDLKTVHFDFDKSNLTLEARKILKANAEWLKKNPSVSVQIEGHCDSRGTIEYNLALGEKRALDVKTYLSNLGIKKKRLSTISYGKERPLITGENEAAWAQNRRANFVIISK